MPTTTDLIGLAIDKNPVDFADTFNQIIMQKATDALEARKVEMANAVYGAEETAEDPEDDFEDYEEIEDDSEDQEDFDDDDDLDIEDLDLDDLDLEDTADDQEDDQ